MSGPTSLHIAVTGFRGIPASWGGVEHQCEETYTRLAARGYSITAYARSHYVSETVRTYKGITIRRLWTLNTKYTEAILHTLLSVLDIIRTAPDIVHVYSQGPCLFLPLIRVLRPRTRIFFTCVGLDWKRKKWPAWASAFIRLGERLSAKWSHQQIVVSRELQGYYRDQYGVKAHYIPNGVTPVSPKIFDKVSAWGVRPRGYYLSVGRLVPEKRVEDLIQAFLAKPRSNALVLVGDAAGSGEYVAHLKSLAGKSPAIVFAGYQFGDVLGELYSNARAFVSASELEGMPLTLLEALAYGVPCVASDIGPHREVLDGTKHCSFPVGSVEMLSRCLDELDGIDLMQLEDAGRQLREHVAEKFTWDAVADQLEELYLRSVGA
ncbi:MAG: glycosyltransferase family 4 protein [Syntrophobacteraceae bacterium]